MQVKRHQTKTLKAKVLFCIIGIVTLQMVCILGIILASGTIGKLDDSAINMLDGAVTSNGENLESQMIKWSQVNHLKTKVESTVEDLAEADLKPISKYLVSEKAQDYILGALSDDILHTLRNNCTTGCFVILDGDGMSRRKKAVYLRDLTPKQVSSYNEDILVEAGSSELLFDNGFTLDTYWGEKLLLPDEADFYEKPMQAARNHPELPADKLGYYSKTFRLRENDIEIMTFTMPLLDESHQPYGVIGVEIGIDYLAKLLDNHDIRIDNEAGYYVGVTEDNKSYSTIFLGSSKYSSRFPSGSIITISPSEDRENLYRIPGSGLSLCSYECKFYESNTPFSNEKWVIGGMISTSSLHSASDKLILSLEVAIAASFIVSILGAMATINQLNEPINVLLEGVRKISPDHTKLPRTNIQEFDELAKAVEDRSLEVIQAGYKVADVLNLSDANIGVLEYHYGSDKIFCTKKVMEMLELPMISWENNYINYCDYAEVLEESKRKFKQEEENVYLYHQSNGKERWLNIHLMEKEQECLCVFVDVTESMREKQKIKRDRDYDVLTNLYNRRAFMRIVSDILNSNECQNGVMSIWDLDNLKYINDTYGHDMGDKYICLLANIFAQIPFENCVCARMSGDEFMMFMYDESIPMLFERFRDVHRAFLKEKLILPSGDKMTVSVSAGMAAYPFHGKTYDELVKHADFAMYEVKNKSKGDIKSFDKDSYIRDYILVQGVGELNRILTEESVRYAFQPIVSVTDYKIFAYEALVRPISDMIKEPTELLRLAETQSKLGQIEKLTWFHAIEDFYSRIQKNGQEKLFLNSIPNQCLKQEEFNLLEKTYGDKLNCLVVEMTENVKMDTKQEQKKSRWCRERGIPLAMDDFGTGYSNSDILLTGQFDFVKLDMSIVRNIHCVPSTQQFVKGIIEYCHANGIRVISEGVEKVEELRQVIELGTDYIQGFYLAKPDYNANTTDFSEFFK